MNELIGTTLEKVLPTFYISKGVEKIKEYIIFNYISNPAYYADNTLQGTNYTILINLYCTKNIEENKRNVLKEMRKSGFCGGTTETTNIEKDSDGNIIYNTAIRFKGLKELSD